MEAVKKEFNQDIYTNFYSHAKENQIEIINFLEIEIIRIYEEVSKKHTFLEMYSKNFDSDIDIVLGALNCLMIKNVSNKEKKIELLQEQAKNLREIKNIAYIIFLEIEDLEIELRTLLTFLLLIDCEKYEELSKKLNLEESENKTIRNLIQRS